MNLEQAKTRMTDIINTKHMKVKSSRALIGELCVIVKFLLDEIERIKTPTLTVLKQMPEPDPHKPIGPPPPPPSQPVFDPPRTPPSSRPYRRGNAGDAT